MDDAHSARKKSATNLSVRVELVRKARALKLNLSEIFEAALAAAIRDAEQRAWLEANSHAIESYNASVAKRGVFSDGWRRF